MMLIGAVLACNLGAVPTATAPPPPTATVLVALPSPSTAPMASASSTPLPTAQPPCTPRTDWPTITVAAGDTLFSIAQRVGTSVDALVAGNCLSNANAISAGQQLHVPTVPNPGCSTLWFFKFSAGQQDPSCPDQAITVRAAGEDFENGRAYWYPDNPPHVYIIYNDHTWAGYIDTYTGTEPDHDPTIVPPAGRYQPVRGIGKTWRTQPGVRDKLGWALEPESDFTGHEQYVNTRAGAPPPGYKPHFYIDHGKNGLVLRLYFGNPQSGQTFAGTWEIAGSTQ